jgi:hypothetical protein
VISPTQQVQRPRGPYNAYPRSCVKIRPISGPRGRAGNDLNVLLARLELGVDALHPNRGRNDSVFQNERSLDDRRDTARSFTVTKVGFNLFQS